MKSRKLRTVLIVVAAIIFAYAVVLFVLTQVQTSKMDDPFARAEKQVFSLDAEKITYIAVQNGNGELYAYRGRRLDLPPYYRGCRRQFRQLSPVR